MMCPHCDVHTRIDADGRFSNDYTEPGEASGVCVAVLFCTSCREPLVELKYRNVHDGTGLVSYGASRMVFPSAKGKRPEPPSAVPIAISVDFKEAAACEPHSARAAAVLARRCLQVMLTDKGYKGNDLVGQLASALNDSRMPTDLHDLLDLVRHVGNYGAHPVPDKSTGLVLEVEDAELDALFGALEEAFDVFYVKPASTKAIVDIVNRKLESAGKPLVGKDPQRRADAAGK